jgi:hypothetical protein
MSALFSWKVSDGFFLLRFDGAGSVRRRVSWQTEVVDKIHAMIGPCGN